MLKSRLVLYKFFLIAMFALVYFVIPHKVHAAELYETYATEDAWISSKFSNNNYGGAYQLFDFYQSSDGTEGRALFKFDLSPVPSTATINDAEVRIYLLGDGQSCYGQPSGNFYWSQINSNWSENSVTWNNQPTTYANALVTVACTTGYRSIFFKNIVEGIVSGEIENKGFMLIGLLPTNSWMRTIMSRENGQNFTAKARITYTPAAPAPGPTPTPTPADPSAGTTSTTSSQTIVADQVGITAGTKAAPATKTSATIAAPTTFLLEDVANSTRAKIKLSWKISESPEIDGYKIFRSEQEKDGFVNIALAEKGTVQFLDETVESGKTYYYFLRSYKGDTESESTATLSMSSTLLKAQPVAQAKSNNISDKDLYIYLGASLALFLAFLLFYELNWKKKLSS